MTPADAERLVGKTGTWRFRWGGFVGRCIGIEERARHPLSKERAPRFVFAGIEQPFIPTWLDEFVEFKESP